MPLERGEVDNGTYPLLCRVPGNLQYTRLQLEAAGDVDR